MAILWYTQKIKVKTKSAKKLIMSDNNNNNSCNSNDDQQSFGSLAEFEGSLSEESKNQFRDAQLIYWKDHNHEIIMDNRQDGKNIFPGSIWLGGQWAARNATVLKERGTTHILTCNGRKPWLIGHNVVSKVLDWDDDVQEKLQDQLQDGIEFVNNVVTDGGVILIHCTAGRSRSVAVAIAYLIHFVGFSFDTALTHIRNIRPWAKPNKGFEQQLRDYESINRRHYKCELCQLHKETKWYYEDKDLLVIECNQCDQPMVVWRHHTMNITDVEKNNMEKALRKVADEVMGKNKYYVDRKQRSIATHLHWHARSGTNPWKLYQTMIVNKKGNL